MPINLGREWDVFKDMLASDIEAAKDSLAASLRGLFGLKARDDNAPDTQEKTKNKPGNPEP